MHQNINDTNQLKQVKRQQPDQRAENSRKATNGSSIQGENPTQIYM